MSETREILTGFNAAPVEGVPPALAGDDASVEYLLQAESDEGREAVQWAEQRLGVEDADNGEADPVRAESGASLAAAPDGEADLARRGRRAGLAAVSKALPEYPEETQGQFPPGGGTEGMHEVARALDEIPGAAHHGKINAINDLLNTIVDLRNWAANEWGPTWKNGRAHLDWSPEDSDTLFDGPLSTIHFPHQDTNESLFQLPNFPAPETSTGKVVSTISQYLTGLFISIACLRGTGRVYNIGGQAALGTIAGGITNFAFTPPNGERLSNVIQSIPGADNAITRFLAHKPGETRMEGRGKNLAEGLAIDLISKGLFLGLRVTHALGKARASNSSKAVARALREDETGMTARRGAGDPGAPRAASAEIKAPGQAGSAARGTDIEASDIVQATLYNMATGYLGGDQSTRPDQTAPKEVTLSADQEDAWKIIQERRQGPPLSDEQTLAARNLWASTGDKVVELARQARDNPSPENLFAFRKMAAIYSVVNSHISGVGAENDWALDFWNVKPGADDEMLKQMTDLVNAGGGLEVSRDLAARVVGLAESGQLVEMGAVLEHGALARTREAAREAWTQGLLSLPKPHLVGALGKTFTVLQRLFERGAAGRIGQLPGDESGARLGEGLVRLRGLAEGAKDGLRLIRKSSQADETGLSPRPAINAESFRLCKGSPLGRVVDVAGSVIRTPGRAGAVADELFKSIGYRGELHAQAFRQAAREASAGTIGKDEINARTAEIIADPPPNLRRAAVDHDAYSAFADAPGQVSQSLARLARKTPELRFVLPFIKTPASILNYAVAQRSPLAQLFRSLREDAAAGGARRQLALARLSTGTALHLAIADLAFSGAITGEGPADPAERQALLRTGWQPYSLKIGDRYHSYEQLGPLSVTFGVSANLAEISNHLDHGDPEADVDEAATCLAGALSNLVMNKNYLHGLAVALEALAEPDGRAAAFFRQLPELIVPPVVKDIHHIRDPYLREVHNLTEAMRARVPGLSQNLEARRDLWGRPVSYRSGLGAFYDAVSPVASRRENPEPIDREMLRLDAYVPEVKRKTDFDDIIVDLARFPGAYQRYAELAGNAARHPVYGRGCLDVLNDVVRGGHFMSQVYKERSDGPTGGKAEFIRSMVQQYRELAKKQLLQEFPELQRELEQKRAAAPARREAPVLPAQ